MCWIFFMCIEFSYVSGYVNISDTLPGCSLVQWKANFDAYSIIDGNLSTCFSINKSMAVQVAGGDRLNIVSVMAMVPSCLPELGLTVGQIACEQNGCHSIFCSLQAVDMAEHSPFRSITSCTFVCSHLFNRRDLYIAFDSTVQDSISICSVVTNWNAWKSSEVLWLFFGGNHHRSYQKKMSLDRWHQLGKPKKIFIKITLL